MSTGQPINRAEFYGMMFAVFSFLFAIHMSRTIIFPWFYYYIAVLIVVVQVICLYYFLKHFKR